MIRILKVSILIFFVLYIFLAIVGGILSYSPVPFWDMWDGYLDFYVKASLGDWSVWWGQHNEHRIVLSRILFWIDNYFFNGRLVFLIIFNYLLIVGACLIYRKIILIKFDEQPADLGFLLSLVTFCLLFSWTQKENITWGFQSQFFLAQILPLLAFFLLFHAERKKSTGFFILACFIGFLASVSMANGVIALPLMLFLALLMHINLMKIFILAILSVSSITLYFHGYGSPPGHGSLSSALSSEPLLVVQYVVLYLGAPFYYLTGKGAFSQSVAQLSGLLLIIGSAYFLIKSIKSNQNVNINYVLLIFILYVGGTAVGTAGGRAIFGLDQALAGRYMTPVLMAWIALTLLSIEYLKRLYAKRPTAVLVVILLIQIALFPSQLHALDDHTDTHFQKMVGGLSLELGARDGNKVGTIFPSVEWALQISHAGSKNNVSIFSHPLIRDVGERLGTKLNEVPSGICQGALDEVRSLPSDNYFIAVRGWLFDPLSYEPLGSAYLIDSQQDIVGYALLGGPRPDVKIAVHEKAEHSGFEGYAISDRTSGKLKLVSSTCYLPVTFPDLPYVVRDESFGNDLNVIKSDSVADVGGWIGSDYYRSHHPELNVYGTFVSSDSDVGKIKLVIKNGDSIYYRSGPSSIGQRITIDNSTYNLPLANEWVLLTLKIKTEGAQEVILEDSGSEWGQWSAIAVRRLDNAVN
ncbi:hypothetical protein ACSV5M_12725 [Cellvibrio sp. ARAG 10.3]|uniref:hypothetical protein n=1 Tax=Cellvibrio sp. ARAG 10.3 TaxID=3451358 RepID=UPI003F47669C